MSDRKDLSLNDPMSCGFAVVSAWESRVGNSYADKHTIMEQMFKIPFDKFANQFPRIKTEFEKMGKSSNKNKKALVTAFSEKVENFLI